MALALRACDERLPRAELSVWTVDDMWGVYPRPSEPTGFGQPRGDGELVAVHPADLQFLA